MNQKFKEELRQRQTNDSEQPGVHLSLMTESDFKEYRPRAIAQWTETNQRAGNISSDYHGMEECMNEMTPNGIHTPGEYLFNVMINSTTVGIVWLTVKNRNQCESAWISDIEIYEKYRRQGYGLKALQLVESYVNKHFPHIDEFALQVHENNYGARALYKKFGLEKRYTKMSKYMKNTEIKKNNDHKVKVK